MARAQSTSLLERYDALPAAGPLRERLTGTKLCVYLVGGAVRDLALGRAPFELDLVLEDELAGVAERLGVDRLNVTPFGTASVLVDGFVYDLARARRESYPRPGALPNVSPADLASDLTRRDFTVNAIALGVHGPSRGELRAAPHAHEDLEARTLRALHPESFRDDPTRLLRLARYASRLDFEIEPATFALAQAAVRGGALDTVSGSRLGAELRLLAREPDPVAALGALGTLHLAAALAPGFGLRDPALARRALALLPTDGDPMAVALAAAALGLAPDELDALLARLDFSAPARDLIRSVALNASPLAAVLARAGSPAEIAGAVGAAAPETVALAGALGPAEPARRWLQTLRHVTLEITGTDLLAAGVPAGPAVGAGLRAARAAKLDGLASGREAELAAALRAALA